MSTLDLAFVMVASWNEGERARPHCWLSALTRTLPGQVPLDKSAKRTS